MMSSSGNGKSPTGGSLDLAALAIQAHGGTDRWNNVSHIEVSLNLTGSALEWKGYPGRLQPTCHINVRDTKVVFQGLGSGNQDDKWIFTPKRTWIERRDGTVLASRDNPYANFLDHTRTTPWDDLDLACFAGYALHNYLTFPFHLLEPGFEYREVDSHEENDETWRVLEVTFPDHHLAHSKIQLFYFDQDLMLRRVDYAPTAFKAPASHYCFDVKEISGLKIPTLRRVVSRMPNEPIVNGVHGLRGRTKLVGPTVFLLDYIHVVVHDEDSETSVGVGI
ncbi:hypothetical protein V2G26_010389 [Clonostachys chloroleuca]